MTPSSLVMENFTEVNCEPGKRCVIKPAFKTNKKCLHMSLHKHGCTPFQGNMISMLCFDGLDDAVTKLETKKSPVEMCTLKLLLYINKYPSHFFNFPSTAVESCAMCSFEHLVGKKDKSVTWLFSLGKPSFYELNNNWP